MPIILSSPTPGKVGLSRPIDWTSSQVVDLSRRVDWTTRIVVEQSRAVDWTTARLAQVARIATWSTTPQLANLTRFIDWQGTQPAELSRTVVWNTPTDWPVTTRLGTPPRSARLSSNAGQVISAQYSHTGTRESLNLTVVGKVDPLPQLALHVLDAPGTGLHVSLDGDLMQFEQRQTPTGWVTVLHAENHTASRLGSFRLPELIPWQLSPTPKGERGMPCAERPEPQTVAVTSVLTQSFQLIGASLQYAPHPDPFTGVLWKEGERDYSTVNKTPDQVFADTLGQLGYTYAMRDKVAWVIPPASPTLFASVRKEDLATEVSVRAEATNTPSLLTVTGADLLVDKPDLIQLVSSAPDPASLQHELLQEAEWYVTTPTATGETIKGFRKSAGVIIATAELTLSDVTVQETVDGVLQTRTFSHVVTGFTSTTSTYDPMCIDAVLAQETVKQSFSYTLGTETSSQIFSGPGFVGGYSAGTPLGDEHQFVSQTYSPEGYLSYRTTSTRKLVSVKQQDADAAPKDRGEITANEYLSTILSESFQPMGGGQWMRAWNLSGAQQVPLYDADSGDAVRLSTKGGVINGGQELLDSAPPQVRCPDPCAGKKIGYPQVVRLSLSDGREGQEVSRSLGFIDSSEALALYASGIAASLAASHVLDVTLTAVQDWRPGVGLTGNLSGLIGPFALVESYSLDAAAGMVTAKLTCRELSQSSSEPLSGDSGPGPFRDQVTWRLPGGVMVNHFKGVKQGKPQFDRIFVRVTGANLPNPGDELEWRRDLRFGPTATGNYGT